MKRPRGLSRCCQVQCLRCQRGEVALSRGHAGQQGPPMTSSWLASARANLLVEQAQRVLLLARQGLGTARNTPADVAAPALGKLARLFGNRPACAITVISRASRLCISWSCAVSPSELVPTIPVGYKTNPNVSKWEPDTVPDNAPHLVNPPSAPRPGLHVGNESLDLWTD